MFSQSSTDSGYSSLGTESQISAGSGYPSVGATYQRVTSALSQMSADSGYHSVDATSYTDTLKQQDRRYLLPRETAPSSCYSDFINPYLLLKDNRAGVQDAQMTAFPDSHLNQENACGINGNTAISDVLLYLPKQSDPMHSYLLDRSLVNGFRDAGPDSVLWFDSSTPDSGYSSAKSSWASSATSPNLYAFQQLQVPLKRSLNSGAKTPKASDKKNYVCPVPACQRGFVRKFHYDNHLKSKHAGYAVSGDMSSATLQSPKLNSEPKPARQPESGMPERSRSSGNLAVQALQETTSLDSSVEHYSTKKKTETVNEWLEKIQDNDDSATSLLKSDGGCIESQQSTGSVSTPRLTSFSRSCSGASDSLWFESDGEASFVLGEDLATSATPNESGSSRMSTTVLAQELVTRYLAQTNAQVDRTESSSQTSSVSSTSGQTNATANASSITTPPSSSLKSARKRSLPGDEEEGSRRSKLPRLSDESPPAIGSKLLACPYSKFDSRRYSERNELEKNYRGCSSCFLRDIARLKQHLYRVHCRPEHHCPTCFSSFDLRLALDAHIVERSCQQQSSPFEEKMTPDQLTFIKRRGLGRSRLDAWFDIYKILFPESPLPLDPYVDSTYADNVQDFMAFFEREGQQVLASEINLRMFGTATTTPEEQEFVDRVLSESINVLLQRLDSRFRRDSSSDS